MVPEAACWQDTGLQRGMSLWAMGVYRGLMEVVETFELEKGFDVAGRGGVSEARVNLSLRCGQAMAEEVSTASHLSFFNALFYTRSIGFVSRFWTAYI